MATISHVSTKCGFATSQSFQDLAASMSDKVDQDPVLNEVRRAALRRITETFKQYGLEQTCKASLLEYGPSALGFLKEN